MSTGNKASKCETAIIKNQEVKLSRENLAFLKRLSANNNREWFDAHKSDFLLYQEEFKAFHQQVHTLMNTHDQIAKGKVYRIYRDVRFSLDKTPYKNHWSGAFSRATRHLRGGYYYEISPGGSYAAGGFFGPNSQDLLHLRKQISQDPDHLKTVLNSPQFEEHFGELLGEKVKTAPKGFSIDDPAIDLLRHKQFIVEKSFKDEEVLSDDFSISLNNTFQAMRPFFDVMSDFLTTNLNGESLLN